MMYCLLISSDYGTQYEVLVCSESMDKVIRFRDQHITDTNEQSKYCEQFQSIVKSLPNGAIHPGPRDLFNPNVPKANNKAWMRVCQEWQTAHSEFEKEWTRQHDKCLNQALLQMQELHGRSFTLGYLDHYLDKVGERCYSIVEVPLLA